MENSPELTEYHNLQVENQIQNKLDRAENAGFQMWLSGDYLFTPYLNNHGDIISTNPSDKAIGYDAAIFDGGLYSAQANISHKLFNGKLMSALNQRTKTTNANYQYQIVLAKHNLKKEVTEQYLACLRTQELIQLALENKNNLNEQLKLTADMTKTGFVPPQDYLLLKIEVKSQGNELSNLRQEYENNLLQLCAMSGVEDTTVTELSIVQLEIGTTKTESDFLQKYSLDSLTMVNDQLLFETKYRPQLEAFANTGINAIELPNIERKFGFSVGLSLTIPLFDGNQKSLTRQRSQIGSQTINEYREFSEHNINLQRANCLQQIESLRMNIDNLTGQAEDYYNLLDVSSHQLQQGTMSMLDYLNLLRNYIDLQKSKIAAENDLQLTINNYNYWNW